MPVRTHQVAARVSRPIAVSAAALAVVGVLVSSCSSGGAEPTANTAATGTAGAPPRGQAAGNDAEAVRQIIDRTVDAINLGDSAEARSVSCDPGNPVATKVSPDAFVDLPNGYPQVQGDKVTVPVRVRLPKSDQDSTVTFTVEKRATGWCVS